MPVRQQILRRPLTWVVLSRKPDIYLEVSLVYLSIRFSSNSENSIWRGSYRKDFMPMPLTFPMVHNCPFSLPVVQSLFVLVVSPESEWLTHALSHDEVPTVSQFLILRGVM